MSKFVCSVCGYIYEGEAAPEFCPQCKAPASKFNKLDETASLVWADELRLALLRVLMKKLLQDLK